MSKIYIVTATVIYKDVQNKTVEFASLDENEANEFFIKTISIVSLSIMPYAYEFELLEMEGAERRVIKHNSIPYKFN